ncbi:response regulator transcription factor [Asinibacterium sp. OR53]|uniref:response regulator transcription factor n=1 Tax=Asinibacterium sp. OR53 TaxID=925409 RepID=UPI00047BF34F|nr:response regulator transcription factor [Asinibacterium sp. OR53]
MIKIALVDDHVVLRKSLAVLINMLQDFKVTIEAGNGEEFIEQLKEKGLPDIALLDITMPVMDGVETARWVKQHHPQVKVVALSMIKNDLVVIRMLKNGARGYILKDCEPEELRDALHQVQEKGYYYNELLTPRMKANDKYISEEGLRSMMNEKELAFLRWTCTDKTYKEIADEMGVSVRTVDGYRDALFQKLNVTTRVGLAIYAIRNGIVVL